MQDKQNENLNKTRTRERGLFPPTECVCPGSIGSHSLARGANCFSRGDDHSNLKLMLCGFLILVLALASRLVARVKRIGGVPPF